MSTTIFIPERIKVGYQKRQGTYNGKLAYVIYYDGKGVLRKEKSWDSWRDGAIEPHEFNNEPTSGFVLNKKVGGDASNGWDVRQTYSRVYDPRGFEFEITVPNLLYILQNVNCMKGKGLEGDFVYGWDGTELLLIPTAAPEYEQHKHYSAILDAGNIKAKDLIPGATYVTRKNEQWIYLGKFEEWKQVWDDHHGYHKDKYESLGKKFYFYHGKPYSSFETRSSISNFLIACASSEPVANYADLMDKLERQSFYSPIEASKDVYTPVTRSMLNGRRHLDVYVTFGQRRFIATISIPTKQDNRLRVHFKHRDLTSDSVYYWTRSPEQVKLEEMFEDVKTIEQFMEFATTLQMTVRKRYLRNGKEYTNYDDEEFEQDE